MPHHLGRACIRDYYDQSEVGDVLFPLFDSFTTRRTAIVSFAGLHPAFMSKFAALFSTSLPKHTEGPATPADTPSPAGQCDVELATCTDCPESPAVDARATVAAASQGMRPIRHLPAPKDQSDHGALSAANTRSCLESRVEQGNYQPKTKRRKTTASSMGKGCDENRNAGKLVREEHKAKYIQQVVMFGPPDIWTYIWGSLRFQRGRMDALFDEPTNKPQDLRNTTDGDVVEYLQSLVKRSEGLTTDNALEIARKRHELRQVADLYDAYGKYRQACDLPIAVLFAETMLPQKTAAIHAERLTDQETHKRLAQVWRNHIKMANRWRTLSDAFGCGFLLLLPANLYEEGGRLLDKTKDESIVATIAEKYPTLRKDLSDLSDMFATFCMFGCLPDNKLYIETLDRNKIPADGLTELRKLLRYHKESPGKVTDLRLPADGYAQCEIVGIDCTVNPALLKANPANHVDDVLGKSSVAGNSSVRQETKELGVDDVLQSSLFAESHVMTPRR